jgi:hypothetical protein
MEGAFEEKRAHTEGQEVSRGSEGGRTVTRVTVEGNWIEMDGSRRRSER